MSTLPARLPARLQHAFFKKMENSLCTQFSGQINPPVEHCGVKDKLLDLYSQEGTGLHLLWGEYMHIIYNHQMEEMFFYAT